MMLGKIEQGNINMIVSLTVAALLLAALHASG